MTAKMPLPVSLCYVGVCRSPMQLLICHSLWKAPNFSSDVTGIPGGLLVSSEMLQCEALNKRSGEEYIF